MALSILLTMGSSAVAIPAPADDLRWASKDLRTDAIPLSTERQDADVNIGPAGAMLEREYFQASPSSDSGSFLCRIEPSIFAKARLTQSCR